MTVGVNHFQFKKDFNLAAVLDFFVKALKLTYGVGDT